MVVSPCTALCGAGARPSPRHASTWSFRSATGAPRLSSAVLLYAFWSRLSRLASARGGAHIDILHSVVEPPLLSSAFLPSKKADWAHPFRPLGVGQLYRTRSAPVRNALW